MGQTLTPKQKAFADAYIANGGNATKAALEAGYKENSAYSIGCENLKKPEIAQYVAERQGSLENTRLLTLQEIQEFRCGLIQDKRANASDKLKAAEAYEKAVRIKEEQEEKKRAAEEAKKARMFHVDLNDMPDSLHPFIRSIRTRKYREFINKGGRGGAKSTDFAMMIPELIKNHHDIHALVCRKVSNTIKDSVFAAVMKAIHNLGLDDEFESKKSPFEITYKATGQRIYFRGADDPAKIKSIQPEFGYIGVLWFEELDQFAGPEEVRNIEQSAIRGGELAWIFKSFNPPKSRNNWANEYVVEPKDSKLVWHTNYTDLPEEWLGPHFLSEAEHMKAVNPVAYEHEYLGVPNGNGGNVFDMIEVRRITDEEIERMDRIYQGVDWGWFPDQFAFLRTHYDSAREKIYLMDELYANKMSNAETAQWIHDKGYYDYSIICDSAEPKSVGDYKSMGLPARSAIKGPGSVEYGFKWLQTRTLVIDPERTPNAYKEIKKYEYERDRDGNVISGYPDGEDHAISALRYAYEPLFNKRGSNA